MPRPGPILVLLLLLPVELHAQFPIAAPEKRPAFGIQRSPAVAANGEDFLTAWEDGRASHNGSPVFGTGPQFDIYATRIDRDGNTLSDGGVAVNPSSSYEQFPMVVWNGSEYVVIHQSPFAGGGVVFSRVLPDRIADRKLLGADFGAGGRFDAAWNGDRYLLVTGNQYGPNPDGAKLRLLLATSDFDPATPEFLLSSSAFLPTVAAGDSNFLVVWLVEHPGQPIEVHAGVIRNDGTIGKDGVLATFDRNPTIPPAAPSIAWNGSSFFVVWSDAASIRARYVDREGNPAPDTFTIARSQNVEVTDPDVAWNGSIFLISFSYRNEWPMPSVSPTTNLYAARVAADGALIDAPFPLTITTAPGGNDASAIAAAGSTFIVVWAERWDIFSATVDAVTGAVTEPRLVARSVWEQSGARGVFDGSNLGFVWQESTGYPGEEPLVLFSRVTPDGEHLDGGGLQIGRGFVGPIAVADVYLVTWHSWAGRRYAVRMTKQGELLDDQPLQLPSVNGILGTDGEKFLYVGTQTIPSEDGSYNRTVLRVWTIGSSGAISAAAEIIPPAQFNQGPVRVAWNGSRYLLLYRRVLGRDDCYRCLPAGELWMVMLDEQGRRLTTPVQIEGFSTGMVTAGGDRFLIVTRGSTENQYRVIGNDGGVLRSGTFLFEPGDVAWNGNVYTIAGARTGWIYLLRVGSDGLSLGEKIEPATAGNGWTQLIPANGALAVLQTVVERTSYAHDAGVLRYTFSWLEQRRRAVAR
jgi:hypothetical protein